MRKLLISSPLLLLSLSISECRDKPVRCNCTRGPANCAAAATHTLFELCRRMTNINPFIGTVALGLTMAVGEITAVNAAAQRLKF